MKFLPTCLPSGLTVAAPDAFGRILGVLQKPYTPFVISVIYPIKVYQRLIKSSIPTTLNSSNYTYNTVCNVT